ncbi:MAG: hypothetical protein ACI9OH_002816 [Oleispira sp.]
MASVEAFITAFEDVYPKHNHSLILFYLDGVGVGVF